MKGDLFLNGKNARAEYGVVLGDGGMASLICPGPAKTYVFNDVRSEHGKQYLIDNNGARIDERSLSLTLYILASSYEDLYAKLEALSAEVFEPGLITIATSFQPMVMYHCIYKGCQQLTEFNGRLAKFTLSLVESNPKDREWRGYELLAFKLISSWYSWNGNTLSIRYESYYDDASRLCTSFKQKGNTAVIVSSTSYNLLNITAWTNADKAKAEILFRKTSNT